MRGGTLFSGIGAPECAAPGIDWRWAAEIDPFAAAVHRTHFPDVPNLGDVTTVDWRGVEDVDALIFGSPCQSFSVAGRRGGLDDPRVTWPSSPLTLLIESGQHGSLSRMFVEYYQATAEGTSEHSSVKLRSSGIGIAGGFLTLNTSESRNGAVVCSLLDILEKTGDLPSRFYLTTKACAGILRRAAKRRKTLPAPLRAALEAGAAPASTMAP